MQNAVWLFSPSPNIAEVRLAELDNEQTKQKQLTSVPSPVKGYTDFAQNSGAFIHHSLQDLSLKPKGTHTVLLVFVCPLRTYFMTHAAQRPKSSNPFSYNKLSQHFRLLDGEHLSHAN